MKTALALYIYSMEYEPSPLAYAEIKHIQSKTGNLELSLDECIDIIKGKNIQLGPNPFILKCLDELIGEYEKNGLYSQLLYFLELKFDLKGDEETLAKINDTRENLEN